MALSISIALGEVMSLKGSLLNNDYLSQRHNKGGVNLWMAMLSSWARFMGKDWKAMVTPHFVAAVCCKQCH
jgi:hypothetical protein